eukprot:3246889-Amphidinium_carterae.1
MKGFIQSHDMAMQGIYMMLETYPVCHHFDRQARIQESSGKASGLEWVAMLEHGTFVVGSCHSTALVQLVVLWLQACRSLWSRRQCLKGHQSLNTGGGPSKVPL